MIEEVNYITWSRILHQTLEVRLHLTASRHLFREIAIWAAATAYSQILIARQTLQVPVWFCNHYCVCWLPGTVNCYVVHWHSYDPVHVLYVDGTNTRIENKTHWLSGVETWLFMASTGPLRATTQLSGPTEAHERVPVKPDIVNIQLLNCYMKSYKTRRYRQKWGEG